MRKHADLATAIGPQASWNEPLPNPCHGYIRQKANICQRITKVTQILKGAGWDLRNPESVCSVKQLHPQSCNMTWEFHIPRHLLWPTPNRLRTTLAPYMTLF